VRNYLLGICLGGVAAATFWHFYPGFWKHPAAEEAATAAMQQRAALLAEAAPARTAAAEPAPRASRTACAFGPLIPPSGAADGRIRMEHPFPAGPRAKAKVFLRAAARAAANGRLRDEEVALIAACRYSDEASAAPTVPLARVLGLLGDRYVSAAAVATHAGLREELLGRAGEVLALSAETYARALGPNAPRSREARQRAAALAEGWMAAADATQPQEAPRRTAAAPSFVQEKASEVPRKTAAAPAPARPVAARARPVAPRPPAAADAAPGASGKAPAPRDPPPPREAADPQLRQLASDLARLRAQAEAVSDDPAGLRRRADLAQAQRAQCPDTACLRDWYARRRRELLAEF
jgi:hypothetical protein